MAEASASAAQIDADDEPPALNALQENIARRGNNAYYYAHGHRNDAPAWDGDPSPMKLENAEPAARAERTRGEPRERTDGGRGARRGGAHVERKRRAGDVRAVMPPMDRGRTPGLRGQIVLRRERRVAAARRARRRPLLARSLALVLSQVISLDAEGDMRVWDLRTMRCVQRLNAEEARLLGGAIRTVARAQQCRRNVEAALGGVELKFQTEVDTDTFDNALAGLSDLSSFSENENDDEEVTEEESVNNTVVQVNSDSDKETGADTNKEAPEASSGTQQSTQPPPQAGKEPLKEVVKEAANAEKAEVVIIREPGYDAEVSPDRQQTPQSDKTGHVNGIQAHTPSLVVDSCEDNNDSSLMKKVKNLPVKLAFEDDEENDRK